MFIGHAGVGLALKRIDPRINLGWLMAATFLLDLLLWFFVLFDLESVIIPSNYASLHYFLFQFPFSHSLVASLAWSAAGFAVTRAGTKNLGMAWVISAGIFSHFLLDGLVHPPQLPLLGLDSPRIGLSLWNILPLELFVEFALLAGGLYVYYSGTKALTAVGRYGIAIFFALLTFAAFAGQLLGPAPESGTQAAISSLGTLTLLLTSCSLLDRKRIAKEL